MHRFRRLALSTVVWLTAASNVLAGIPEVVCRCAHKPTHTASSPDAALACCCCASQSEQTPTCCVLAEPTEPEQRSCCNGHVGQTEEIQDVAAASGADEQIPAGPSVAPASCKRGLAHTPLLAVSLSSGQTFDQVVWQFTHAIDALMATAAAAPVAGVFIWDVQRLPPPTDLITLYERRTI